MRQNESKTQPKIDLHSVFSRSLKDCCSDAEWCWSVSLCYFASSKRVRPGITIWIINKHGKRTHLLRQTWGHVLNENGMFPLLGNFVCLFALKMLFLDDMLWVVIFGKEGILYIWYYPDKTLIKSLKKIQAKVSKM